MADIEKLGIEFKVLTAQEPAAWNKLSFWGRATDVKFSDDTNVQDKLGNIDGITSNFSTNEHTAVASDLFNYVCGESKIVNLPYSYSAWPYNSQLKKYVYTDNTSVTKLILSHPIMYLSVDTLPSDKLLDFWNGLQMVATNDGSRVVLTFYADRYPSYYSLSSNISIGIKGVV